MPTKSTSPRLLPRLAAVTVALFALAASAKDHTIPSYIVGVDGLAELASGPFAGRPNPNHQRLTFLMAHTYPDAPGRNHYHSIGRLVYQEGEPGTEPTIRVNPANHVPEGSVPPLRLLPAPAGPLQGRLISLPDYHPEDDEYDYAFLTVVEVDQLAGQPAGSPRDVLLNSSNGRWRGSVRAADIVLELVDLTPGLNVADADGRSLFTAPGDRQRLGSTFTFSPVFWAAAEAAPGRYTARFRLRDANGNFADSGEFEFRFQVAP